MLTPSLIISGFINKSSPGGIFMASNLLFFASSTNMIATVASATVFGLALGLRGLRRAETSGSEKQPWFHKTYAPFLDVAGGDPVTQELRLNASGLLVSALSAFMQPGGMMYGVVGLSYSASNFCASSKIANKIQHTVGSNPPLRLFTHSAFYSGLADIGAGIIAGGGSELFVHPMGNIPAFATSITGFSMVAFGMMGLLGDKFSHSSAPYMMNTLGWTAIMATAALTGKPVFAISSAMAVLGLFRLAAMDYQKCALAQTQTKVCCSSVGPSGTHDSVPKGWGLFLGEYARLSDKLLTPLKILERKGILKIQGPVP